LQLGVGLACGWLLGLLLAEWWRGCA